MIRKLLNLLLFQKKIFFRSYLISIVIGLLAERKLASIGFSFLFISLFIHYFSYEIKNKENYYYYFNLGFSKIFLWFSTLIIGLFNCLILTLI